MELNEELVIRMKEGLSLTDDTGRTHEISKDEDGWCYKAYRKGEGGVGYPYRRWTKNTASYILEELRRNWNK